MEPCDELDAWRVAVESRIRFFVSSRRSAGVSGEYLSALPVRWLTWFPLQAADDYPYVIPKATRLASNFPATPPASESLEDGTDTDPRPDIRFFMCPATPSIVRRSE